MCHMWYPKNPIFHFPLIYQGHFPRIPHIEKCGIKLQENTTNCKKILQINYTIPNQTFQ